MPWSNQNGGGWKGGGPWGSGSGGGGGGGPWGGGGGPQRGGNNNTPPDLEELLRRSQEKLRQVLPGGGGGRGGSGGIGMKTVLFAGAALVAVWLATGFYRVDPGEVGVELVFGRYYKTTQPGLNYNWPSPIGSVVLVEIRTLSRRPLIASPSTSSEAPFE